KRDVVHPQWRVGRRQWLDVVAQVKERDERAILQPKEEMRVRAIFARAGHVVALDDVIERQAQNVFVEMPRLLGIARLVGVVVQLLNGSRGGQGGGGGPGGSGHGEAPRINPANSTIRN